MKNLFPFTELKAILDLSQEDEELDYFIYEATLTYTENYLQRTFEDTIPSDLKEAIIKLFLIKKAELQSLKNGDMETEEIPDSIKNVLDFYKVKTL